jgi:hypothetical protein
LLPHVGSLDRRLGAFDSAGRLWFPTMHYPSPVTKDQVVNQ